MTPDNSIPFFDMFSCCRDDAALYGVLEKALVFAATVDKKCRTMRIRLGLKTHAAPVVLQMVEKAVAEEFGLSGVEITPVYEESEAESGKSDKKARRTSGTVIMGRQIKDKPVPMSEVTLESGRVTVCGEVFAVDSREIQKCSAFVLSFDMSDGTNSLRVSKFMRDEKAAETVGAIKPGMYLTVQGDIGLDRYYKDITMEPRSIVLSQKEVRTDNSENTRVELHLHTQMSAMDALTDTAAVVKRAIEWGHRAIAITDHGVCQAFPDAMKAAGDKIKVLYGIEGYYLNDVDDKIALFGIDAGSFGDEYVAFDVETTGLDSYSDRITEIGAVLMRGGEELARFCTFSDPEMHIPAAVSKLTGITDSDVAGAPPQEEAVRSFLRFAGDRPLVAHNASFDIGFIYEASLRYGIPFEPKYIDTLTMAQGLLPELKSHRLNNVAERLSLPEFRHHRAADDALTAGLILSVFFKMLEREGVTSFSGLNEAILRRRIAAAEKRRSRPQHIILLARTQEGIKNLYKIVTKSHLDYFRRWPTIPKSLISAHREGLLIGSACEAGEVFSLIKDHRSRMEQRRLAEFYDYLEIQPVLNNSFMLDGEHPKAGSVEDLRDFNRRVISLANELNKIAVATGDVHFLEPEHEVYRRVLLTAKEFEDADRPLALYFRTTDEMLEEFSYLGSEKAYEVVVGNANLIADMCDTVRPLPPAGKLYPPKIERSAEELSALVNQRMQELYGTNPPDIVLTRVKTELNDILSRGYDVIYMSAQKLVADSLAHGYLVGSRGSVGSSLVAYLSGITEVNSLPAHYRCPKCRHTDFASGRGYGCGADMPDKNCPSCGESYSKEGFDIPFETFLGFGGDKVPDIDLNFSGEYQAKAHRFTNEMFGSTHVFRAGTIGTIAEKTAHGYVKKYLEKHGLTVTKAEENRLALGCVSVKRTTGQHPGGLVVIPQDMDITDFCPAQHPADDPNGGIITTHFDYHCMEDNLLKLDLLGHDDPTMLKMLEDMTGVNAREIPLDDAETMAIFRSPKMLGLESGDEIIGETGTIGIPEFGTPFTRQMLCDTQPEDFDTLVRLSGFSHGTNVWAGNIRELILSGTATVKQTIGCRDDIMLYLISLGMDERRAFKFMEAVRKGTIHKGKKWPEGIEEEMKALGVPDWYTESCRKIQYLFPKAHAVAYVMMAFRIAWFKVHRPLEFYSAYFYRRSQKDSFDAALMLRGVDAAAAKIREINRSEDQTAKDDGLLTTLEACYEFYRRGYEFLPVDLYKSDPVKFLAENGALRAPFVALSGLGESAAFSLAKHRKDKVFISVEDLSISCPKLSKAHIEQLRNIGALGDLPDTSQLSLF